MHKGIEQDGEHLCLALELERTTLDSVWSAQNIKFHPIPIVKRILRHILHGVAALHKCGVAHTDIKPDNIMVSLAPSWSDETVAAWVCDHPPRVYSPFQSLYKVMTEAIVSEEFPPPSVEELEACDFKVADLSNAQELDDQTTDHITPLTLRAPEVILGGPWDEKVDIWTFGCLVFTMLTKAHLFPDGVRPNQHSFFRFFSSDLVSIPIT
ncbi:Serine/threonine-protein kinase SRPK [Leucoagaricus sp. SymC.cos]|nr:Serine/threonine-protein kinase SRPK [Leucoagaricus sp. SymC.cos]